MKEKLMNTYEPKKSWQKNDIKRAREVENQDTWELRGYRVCPTAYQL